MKPKSNVCAICGKHPSAGRKITRRGLAKKKGGVGRKITGISPRSYRPNLQRIRVVVNGSNRRMNVCTRCIQAGKVQKAG
ncbi:MAG: L28 family ribosomal protein [Planctomycetota bacterium]